MTHEVSRREVLAAAAAGAAVTAGIGFVRPAMAQENASTMITQTAQFGLNPDKKAEAVEALKTLVKAVEDNEPGVLAYIPHVTEDNTKVFFYEVYKDDAALKSHGTQPHMAAIRTAFTSGALKPPVEIVKMERVGGFYRA